MYPSVSGPRVFIYSLIFLFHRNYKELPEYWMKLKLRGSQRLRLVNWALGKPWSVRCTLPWFFTLSWDLSTSLVCQRWCVLVLASQYQSSSHAHLVSQWGQSTSRIDGMPWDTYTIGGHIHSAKKVAMICLCFAPRSAVWLILI